MEDLSFLKKGEENLEKISFYLKLLEEKIKNLDWEIHNIDLEQEQISLTCNSNKKKKGKIILVIPIGVGTLFLLMGLGLFLMLFHLVEAYGVYMFLLSSLIFPAAGASILGAFFAFYQAIEINHSLNRPSFGLSENQIKHNELEVKKQMLRLKKEDCERLYQQIKTDEQNIEEILKNYDLLIERLSDTPFKEFDMPNVSRKRNFNGLK